MKVKIKKSNKKLSIPKFIQVASNYNKAIRFGIPKSNSSRTDGNGQPAITNASILAIMEAGSIRLNIPSRKLLQPVAIKHSAKIKQYFDKIVFYLTNDRVNEADALMEELAFRLETWCKSYFREENGWKPNAPITISGGWMINKITRKPVYIKGKKSDTPLVDTGELRKSIKGLVVRYK